MQTRWFIVPRIGSGTVIDSYRPKYSDRVRAESSEPLPNNRFITKFAADENILNEIATKDDAQPISDEEMRDKLNSLKDENRTISEWNNLYNVII